MGLMLSLIIGVQIVAAQNTTNPGAVQAEPKLSGSRFKTEDMALKADAVFVGEITQMGSPTAKMAGAVVYHGVQVKILQVLRGSIDPQSTFTLYVSGTTTFHEDSPKVGSSYIFFVRKNGPGQPDLYSVLKLLPATDATTAKVKGLIPSK